MKPSINKLQKFFKLEAERNYDNNAVVGGLERMLERWEAEARADSISEELIQAVVSRVRDYGRLSPNSRAEALDGLWKRIQRSMGGPSINLPPHSNGEATPNIVEKPIAQKEKPAQSSQARRPETNKPRKEPAPAAKKPPAPRQTNARSNRQPVQDDQDDYSQDFIGVDSLPEEPLESETSLPIYTMPVDVGPPVEPAALNAPVTVLPGVGPQYGQTLGGLGLFTLRDMLYYLPRRYDDYTRLKPVNRLEYGEEVTVIGTVQSVNSRKVRQAMQITEAVLHDGTAALRLSWFNQPWVAKRLRPGMQIAVSGKVDQYLGRVVMNSPEWEPLDQQQLSTNRIVPVYPLTAKITQRWLRRQMGSVISYWAPRVPDPLPAGLRQSAGVMPISQALFNAHFPDSWETLERARKRLAFDEIFMLQWGLLRMRRQWQENTARRFAVDDDWLSAQIERLPYPLTGAQQKALADLRQDLGAGRPMNRLLQGDVGSGKTTVAALGMALVTTQGAQAALMAPTSILAEQHYKNLVKLLASVPESDQEADSPAPPACLRPEQIGLLVGATPEVAKREIRQGLQDGSIKVIIGTHALIEDPITFADLQLIIIDEQHRFGVEQRAALRSKGDNPHLLVMTATPIPRSLALTVYGDLDLSVMDELPPGRQAIGTYVITPRERERAYSLIRRQVEAGRQAFIIYPLVEESERSESKAAVEEHARLQSDIFPNLRLGLLHGRMRPDEKDDVMTRFHAGEHQVLVSTSVIEVGVDVPNATVMLIEGANRFGLSQLHQFRGRVGRGQEQSYCLLVPETPDAVENERLQVMVETNDGFVLAERDLQQRGPGQFLGNRQSGFNSLQFANLTDISMIEDARRQAQILFDQNPDLVGDEYAPLSAALERFWRQRSTGDIS